MHLTKEELLVTGLLVIFVIALVCGHFNIGMTGGIAVESSLPSSGWDVVTTGVSWLADALTFQTTGLPAMVNTCLWIFIVITIMIPTVLIVRGD